MWLIPLPGNDINIQHASDFDQDKTEIWSINTFIRGFGPPERQTARVSDL